MFRREDLKETFRVEAVETIIRNVADRVVQVKGPSRTGSGIIFKANDEFYVQTSHHVVIKTCGEHTQPLVPVGEKCSECDHIACVIDSIEVRFFQNDALYTTQLFGNCSSLEKAIVRLIEVPKVIYDMDMQDYGWLVVDIRIRGMEKISIKGLLEFYKPEFIIHSSKLIDPGEECTIVFQHDSVPATKITKCSDNCSRIYFDQTFVPAEAKINFHKDLPWETKDCDQQVAVISFPTQPMTLTENKKITYGQPILDPKIGDCLIPSEQIKGPSGWGQLKDVVLLKHDAKVQPGDSGGCVLVMGKDVESRIGYKSYMCMHIAGNNKHGVSSIGLIN
ncbi:hypothetical protein SNE40_022127 [Patella caerulea]